MHEYLDSIAEWSGAAEDWRPISRGAILAWLIFYVIFLLYAFRMHGGYLFIDSANLVVHEGGHLLFRWFGPTLCLWGGTILQWMVPLLLTVYFFPRTSTCGLRVLPVLLLRELALHGDLHGRRACHGFAPGYHRRSRLRRARLEHDIFKPGTSGLRHGHRRRRADTWLVRNAGQHSMASRAPESIKAVSGSTSVLASYFRQSLRVLFCYTFNPIAADGRNIVEQQ